jgi:hypothetical protein
MEGMKMKDNTTAAIKSAAAIITAHATAKHITAHSLRDLNDALENETAHNNLYVEYRANIVDTDETASCELSIRSVPTTYATYKDNEGNVCAEKKLEVGLNWPSWGTAPLNIVKQRLALMNEVTVLLEELTATVGEPFTYVVMTAEEEREREERALQLAQIDLSFEIMLDSKDAIRGTRVGKSVLITHKSIASLTSDDTNTMFRNKCYKITKHPSDPSSAFITRTS